MSAGPVLTPDLVLLAYSQGIFPMAESRGDQGVFWVDPERRGIIPIGGFHISRSLRRTLRSGVFKVTFDTAFDAVMAGCADRPETWISAEIARTYGALHAQGHAHSVEVWAEGALVGGVYGVALGGAFFGESMFSRQTDASKVALAYLLDRLALGGFTLFDTQFLTSHLASLGGREVSRATFRRMLRAALEVRADFIAPGPAPRAYEVIQRNAQTSYRA